MPYVILLRDAHARLLSARRKREWAQVQLARLSGVSIGTLKAMERGLRTRFQEEPVVRVCSQLRLDLPTVIQEGPMSRSPQVSDRPVAGNAETATESRAPVQLFVAAPMASIGRTYARNNKQVIALVAALERELSLSPIYYAGMALKTPREFEDETLALRNNLSALTASRRFVLVYPRPLPTSALIELGYAMAMKIPTRIFVRDWKHLPFMLRSATRVCPEIAILRYRTLDDVLALLREEREFLQL